MVRRRRGSSFMASAFVFPGGGVDGDESPQECAARELLEEAGVALLTRRDGAEASERQIAELRRELTKGESSTADLLAAAGLRWNVDALAPWSHWVTPSLEPKRFSAHFFIAALPAGQHAQPDEVEAVELAWVRPEDAPLRAGELSLPPPQLRTLWELAGLRSIESVLDAAHQRATEPAPILPRVAKAPGEPGEASGALCLLLPWDPQYAERGQGEAHPLSPPPRWAVGPSRFVLESSASKEGPRVWRHVHAPGSTIAG